jgi:hypothetical protein
MLWSDMAQLIGAILLIVGALLPVVNPLGDAPIFLRMTPGCDEPTRAFLAKRIAFYSFFLVLGSLLLGSFVLLLSILFHATAAHANPPLIWLRPVRVSSNFAGVNQFGLLFSAEFPLARYFQFFLFTGRIF